jgi:hypothetical protein
MKLYVMVGDLCVLLGVPRGLGGLDLLLGRLARERREWGLGLGRHGYHELLEAMLASKMRLYGEYECTS